MWVRAIPMLNPHCVIRGRGIHMTDCTLDSSFQVSLPIQGTGGHKVIPKLK